MTWSAAWAGGMRRPSRQALRGRRGNAPQVSYWCTPFLMFPSAECRSGAVFGLAMTGGALSIRGFTDLCPASETI